VTVAAVHAIALRKGKGSRCAGKLPDGQNGRHPSSRYSAIRAQSQASDIG
jgi:hypothetical protein